MLVHISKGLVNYRAFFPAMSNWCSEICVKAAVTVPCLYQYSSERCYF